MQWWDGYREGAEREVAYRDEGKRANRECAIEWHLITMINLQGSHCPLLIFPKKNNGHSCTHSLFIFINPSHVSETKTNHYSYKVIHKAHEMSYVHSLTGMVGRQTKPKPTASLAGTS